MASVFAVLFALCVDLMTFPELALSKLPGPLSRNSISNKQEVVAKPFLSAVTLALFAAWYHYIYLLPKREYNRVHPYTSWIPITLWVVLRNMTPSMRHYSLSLYGWLGCITLETYISQFHTWLATGVPNGQPKMLLTFFPENYPLLNFAASTAGTSPLLVCLKACCRQGCQ